MLIAGSLWSMLKRALIGLHPEILQNCRSYVVPTALKAILPDAAYKDATRMENHGKHIWS